MRKNNEGLLQSYKRQVLISSILVFLAVVFMFLGVLIYVFSQSSVVIIVFSILSGLALVAYALYYRFVFLKTRRTFYAQLYETTYENLKKIKNNDTNLSSYGDSEYREIRNLSNITSDIKAKFDSAFLIVKDTDYSKFDLEYVDEHKDLVTYASFKKNLQNIIFVSQSFRNIIIDVFYDLPAEAPWNEEDKARILGLYRDVFKEHDHVLFFFGEDGASLEIYVPHIDSFQEIKEKLNYVVTSSSVIIRDSVGIRHIMAKYSIVAYPYSSEEMMLGDLMFARSQEGSFNLYLPTRSKGKGEASPLMNSSMSLNYASKTLNALSKLEYSSTNEEKSNALLESVFDSIAIFMDFDEGGIISYDSRMKNYSLLLSTKNGTLFKGSLIHNEFPETLNKYTDDDNSYFFSTKKHANAGMQQMLGMYGIQSGIYYVVRNFDTKGVTALIYFFNRDKDVVLNSYLREIFMMAALRIENYFEKRDVVDYADAKDSENQNILAMTNMFVYHVDDDNRITYLSKGFDRLFPNAKVGEKCHKGLYGLERRCANCPQTTQIKMYFERKNEKYETSLAFADRKDKDQAVIVRRIYEDDGFGDLFQDDFLIYSFKSFVNVIKNEYLAGGRGYTLLLSIDNYAEIVEKLGPEGYNYLMRDYIRNVKKKLGIEDIYFYNASAIAIHLPYIGHKDIITKIEDIYPLSKADYYKGKDFSTLNISYLPIGYPRGYAHAEDYLKHISDFYHNGSIERNKDFIYFSDFSITRSASKRAFMLSVLEEEFSGGNSTSMNLQPIVHAKTGHIYGAEILLRIADAHRNVFFNAMEISQIAEQEQKTGMITNSIINFIGNMYKEYGENVFKINKFNRIAINIDQTYLGDDEMVKNLVALCEENALPNGFISLEIPEDLIPENKEKIKSLAKTLSKYKIMFSCDRFTGQYTNSDELAELGFNELKIARDLVLQVEKDQTKLHQVEYIVDMAKKNNVALAAVGVENERQLELLKGLDEEIMVQGYYLYKPLTRADFITALISYKG